MYSPLHAPWTADFSDMTSWAGQQQRAYPSPEEMDCTLLPAALQYPPTLDQELYPTTELESAFAIAGSSGLDTPSSLYHSPIFDDQAWLTAAPHQLEGVDRQHALELELGLGDDAHPGAAAAWSLAEEEDGIHSAAPSYTTAVFSPSPAPSSPLTSAAAEYSTSFGPSPTNVPDDLPPPLHSQHYTHLTTLALANRVAHGILPPSSATALAYDSSAEVESNSSSSFGPRRPSSSSSSHLSRSTEGLTCSCNSCGIPIAQLNFRSKGKASSVDTAALVAEFLCLSCATLPEGSGATDRWEDEKGTRYERTLSGVLDRLQSGEAEGQEAEREDEVELRRMRPGLEKDEGVLSCDVCKQLIGSGALRTRDTEDEIDFGVEVVCSHCGDIYSRCSDCGGGGGPRLGVGKWRCKELFAGGRKTCILSHLRLGSLEEMAYDVWPVSDLPPTEIDALIALCKDLHYSTLLQTLATPDSLETTGAIATSYEQVHRLAVDGWTLFEPLLRQNIEESKAKRRYIGLRWSTPIPRKKAKVSRAIAKRERTQSAASSTEMNGGESPSGLLRPGKKIVGFILGELDLSNGTLFLPLIMPSGSVGDTYEATTTLLQHLSERIFGDLARLNAERTAQKLKTLPELNEVWTMTLFTKDPRGVNHLETRRGFSTLEKYGRQNPQSKLSLFSPLSSGILPPELTHGWQVFIRALKPNDDWSAKLTAAAKRKAGAGKEKEKEGAVKGGKRARR